MAAVQRISRLGALGGSEVDADEQVRQRQRRPVRHLAASGTGASGVVEAPAGLGFRVTAIYDVELRRVRDCRSSRLGRTGCAEAAPARPEVRPQKSTSYPGWSRIRARRCVWRQRCGAAVQDHVDPACYGLLRIGLKMTVSVSTAFFAARIAPHFPQKGEEPKKEGIGFEPMEGLHPRQFSRLVP